jgi:predicted nucleotidyltransferase
MSGFAARWLALREPYDLRARNAVVLDSVVGSLARRSRVDIVDLASGTGSTLRALAPRLRSQQSWRLLDSDLDLLAHALSTPAPSGVTLTTAAVDLNRDLEKILARKIDLLTASALLDLVSESWLHRFVEEAARRSLPVYAALSYNGQIEIRPADSVDEAIVTAVNAHQRGDKGFGPALGPLAASAAIARFESLGFSVVHGKADWVIGPQDGEFQMETFRGWAHATKELDELSSADVDEWLTRRRYAVAAQCSSICVGHLDFFARPMGTREADRSQSSNTSSLS